jgi:hypothetical protein
MRLKIMKRHIWSIAFYVAAIWKPGKIGQKYLESSEMELCRRMQKITGANR